MKPEGQFNSSNESNPFFLVNKMEAEIKNWTSELEILNSEYDKLVDATRKEIKDSEVGEHINLNMKIQDLETRIKQTRNKIDTNNDQIKFLIAKSASSN